eukprot:comp29640_c0_seq1/m.47228 comp29640_c0_seq1/g.47228  ORF comp29640_c0_seq1/g.47228 comp29640_c0_seq1/m.47228 type:complete len:102 (-) comp29640_c0_seq1:214-519(-)
MALARNTFCLARPGGRSLAALCFSRALSDKPGHRGDGFGEKVARKLQEMKVESRSPEEIEDATTQHGKQVHRAVAEARKQSIREGKLFGTLPKGKKMERKL